MIEACKQQPAWDVRRYAKLPPPPALLPTQPVPSLLASIAAGVANGLFIVCTVIVALMLDWYEHVPLMKWQVWTDWHLTDTRAPDFAVPFFAIAAGIAAVAATSVWFVGLRPRFVRSQ